MVKTDYAFAICFCITSTIYSNHLKKNWKVLWLVMSVHTAGKTNENNISFPFWSQVGVMKRQCSYAVYYPLLLQRYTSFMLHLFFHCSFSVLSLSVLLDLSDGSAHSLISGSKMWTGMEQHKKKLGSSSEKRLLTINPSSLLSGSI